MPAILTTHHVGIPSLLRFALYLLGLEDASPGERVPYVSRKANDTHQLYYNTIIYYTILHYNVLYYNIIVL